MKPIQTIYRIFHVPSQTYCYQGKHMQPGAKHHHSGFWSKLAQVKGIVSECFNSKGWRRGPDSKKPDYQIHKIEVFEQIIEQFDLEELYTKKDGK